MIAIPEKEIYRKVTVTQKQIVITVKDPQEKADIKMLAKNNKMTMSAFCLSAIREKIKKIKEN